MSMVKLSETEKFEKMSEPSGRFENFWHVIQIAFRLLFSRQDNNMVLAIFGHGEICDHPSGLGKGVALTTTGYQSGTPLLLRTLATDIIQRQDKILRKMGNDSLANADLPDEVKSALSRVLGSLTSGVGCGDPDCENCNSSAPTKH